MPQNSAQGLRSVTIKIWCASSSCRCYGKISESILILFVHLSRGTNRNRRRMRTTSCETPVLKLLDALQDVRNGIQGAQERLDDLVPKYKAGLSVSSLSAKVEQRLVALGINPAGPDPSLQERAIGKRQAHWTDLYWWNSEQPSRRHARESTPPATPGSYRRSATAPMRT